LKENPKSTVGKKMDRILKSTDLDSDLGAFKKKEGVNHF
jgi:hypothetical protein